MLKTALNLIYLYMNYMLDLTERQKCDRKPMNESKNNSNKNVIEGILNSMVLPEYEHVICDIKVKDPSERFDTFGEDTI
jgi:hypothetical protein